MTPAQASAGPGPSLTTPPPSRPSPSTRPSAMGITMELLKTRGLAGLYRGAGATLMRSGINITPPPSTHTKWNYLHNSIVFPNTWHSALINSLLQRCLAVATVKQGHVTLSPSSPTAFTV